ncbi:MAG: 1,4-alpha-glucan branching protein GlgB [Planctomycetes bacterium]|nr:1,4-alpha-glucan branching protein GlgB [Planctomycetota bacterium]
MPAHPSTHADQHHPMRLGDMDLHLFNEGSHFHLADRLGAHPGVRDGVAGTFFAVWAPNAEAVSVLGDFNGWSPGRDPLHPTGSSGIWSGFVPTVGRGALYKYHLVPHGGGPGFAKADPLALRSEPPPHTASVVERLDFEWHDHAWLAARRERNALGSPMSIYEVHLGSWMRVPEEGHRPMGYREIAPRLAGYAREHGFTHVELMPVMEHPFSGSWGYQLTGYFAPTARYGTPADFAFLVDHLHREGIGVILDWVPSHFPTDGHGLAVFDGTHLYEHADPRKGFHPDWTSAIFNYGRHEVRAFLISSALHWVEKYHVDGLRVDAVASMLYLDYSRREGEWLPNPHGGRDNVEAIHFLRRMNEVVYGAHPDVQVFAEESTAWAMVTRPTSIGGLGFGLKWDMGWMHDTLRFFQRESVHRRWHLNDLTFRSLYGFTENFVLPLSHDEVVHGKGSLLGKMPGDPWQKFANLRLLYGYMWAMPGKKLLFMGGELAQWREWQHEESLDWHLLQSESHRGVQRLVHDLNRAHRELAALHQLDCEPEGFEWVAAEDHDNTVLGFLRRGRGAAPEVLVVCNFTPMPRSGYRVGVARDGLWREVLNSDARDYGGSGVGNLGAVRAEPVAWHGRSHSLPLTLPPLGVIYLVSTGAS